MAPCQLQVRAASACGRPHAMCYKSLFKCAFVHHINRPDFDYRSSLRTDLEDNRSPSLLLRKLTANLRPVEIQTGKRHPKLSIRPVSLKTYRALQIHQSPKTVR